MVFAVHSWSVRGFLYNVPSFVLRLTVAETFAIFCYHMAFALLETVICCAFLVALSALLPAAWLRDGFAYRGFLIILAAGILAIIMQFSFAYGEWRFETSDPLVLLASFSAGAVLFLMLYVLSHRVDRLQRFILFIVDQISVMMFIYLPLDAIALLVVAARLLR